MRDLLKQGGLRHIRLKSGTILTCKNWLDEYMESFMVENPGDKVDQIANEIFKDINWKKHR